MLGPIAIFYSFIFRSKEQKNITWKWSLCSCTRLNKVRILGDECVSAEKVISDYCYTDSYVCLCVCLIV